MTRVALLGALAPAERRAAISGYDQILAEEVRRLRAAPRLEGYRGEARRGAIERLEATRRWLRGVSGDTATAGALRETKKGVSGRA